MFRAIILPIFRSTRLCVTACGIMYPRCCRPPALYQWWTVKQMSDNEIYFLIKCIKSVLWRVAKRLSNIEGARCLKVNKLGIKIRMNLEMSFIRPLVRMGSLEPTIKLPISYIINCSSEFHHMPLDTCRDENVYIMSIRFFSWKKASKYNYIIINYHIAKYTLVSIS